MTRIFSCLLTSILAVLIFNATSKAQTGDALFEEAARLDKQGFMQEAIAAWEKILASNPEKKLETATRMHLSRAYLKTAQPFKAVDVVKELATSESENFDVQFHLANALGRIKKYPEAIESFQKTVELKPDEGLGYVGLALSLFGNRNPDAAIERLQEAKKIFKKKKIITWYRDARIMVHQIKSFAIYPPNFSDLWLENNLDLVRKTYEKTVFNRDE